jgi:putative transposase
LGGFTTLYIESSENGLASHQGLPLTAIGILANANAWRNNPRRGRRPRVRKLSMLLHQGTGYRVKDGYVEIIGGIRMKIIG